MMMPISPRGFVALALGGVLGCSAAPAPLDAAATEGAQRLESSGAAWVCNRPSPPPIAKFGPRQAFSLKQDGLSVPAQLDGSRAPSDVELAAFILDADREAKVALSPTWSTGPSGSRALHVPLTALVDERASAGRITTVAFELTDAEGASVWSDAVQLQALGGGGWALRAAAAAPDAAVRQGPRPAAWMGGAPGSSWPVTSGGSSAPTPSAPGASGAAPMALTTVCLRQVVLMTGEGIGEDWLTQDASYGSVGMRVNIPGVYVGSLDSLGCTPAMNIATGTYGVTASALSSVNNRFLSVDTDGDGVVATAAFNIDVTAGIVNSIAFWPIYAQQQFNIAMFATVGLYYNPGSSQTTYKFHARNTHVCGGGSCNSGGDIYINDTGAFDKFLVGHELGHAFFARNTTQSWKANYAVVAAPPCDAGGATGHDIDSVEYSSTTFNEAAATFYAAATFNTPAQTNCWLYHPRYPGGVDCEFGQTVPDLPVRFMEQRCATPWGGRGVELDWLRQLWDVRTNGGSQPSMTTILSWIDGAANFNDTNAYQVLDASANVIGGALNINWDSGKGANGVDH